MAAFGYPGVKISLNVGDAPTVSPVVDRATHRQAPTAKEPLPKNWQYTCVAIYQPASETLITLPPSIFLVSTVHSS